MMEFGNKPSDGGHLLLQPEELNSLGLTLLSARSLYGGFMALRTSSMVEVGYAFGSKIAILKRRNPFILLSHALTRFGK